MVTSALGKLPGKGLVLVQGGSSGGKVRVLAVDKIKMNLNI